MRAPALTARRVRHPSHLSMIIPASSLLPADYAAYLKPPCKRYPAANAILNA